MANIGINGDSIDAAPFSSPTVSSTETFVLVDEIAVLVHGDGVSNHSLDSTVHSNSTVVARQTFFKIGGKNVVIGGDFASCGHKSHPSPDPQEPDIQNAGVIATGFVNIIPLPT